MYSRKQAKSRNDLRDPLQGLPQGACGPNRQDFGPPAEGAPAVSNKWQSSAVCSSGAHGTAVA